MKVLWGRFNAVHSVRCSRNSTIQSLVSFPHFQKGSLDLWLLWLKYTTPKKELMQLVCFSCSQKQSFLIPGPGSSHGHRLFLQIVLLKGLHLHVTAQQGREGKEQREPESEVRGHYNWNEEGPAHSHCDHLSLIPAFHLPTYKWTAFSHNTKKQRKGSGAGLEWMKAWENWSCFIKLMVFPQP